MSITRSQYDALCAMISFDAQRNWTFVISMPADFQISTMYWPTSRILVRSPPILLLSIANQSATQKRKTAPADVSLFTFTVRSTPCAMCMRPDGSKPS